jgi:iron complex outermembrane receptor protein
MKTRPLFLSVISWFMILYPLSLWSQGDEPADAPPLDPKLVDEIFRRSPEEMLNLPTRLTTGDDQGWLETPAAAYILTQEDLLHSGHNHLAEQLRMVPGLMVSQHSSNAWAISTRSFEHVFADMQLVLQDGRELYSPTFGGVFWDQADLPVEILDSIEVIRGPGSTLWGSNAVNGIINIQTLDAIEAQENMISVGGGNQDYAHLSFRQGGEIFGGHYYTWGKVASYKSIHDPNPSPQIDTYPENEMQKFGFRADLPGFGEEGWTLRAEYSNSKATRRFGGPYYVTLDPNTFLPNSISLSPDFLGPDEAHGWNVHGEWGGLLPNDIEWQLISYYAHKQREWVGTGLDFLVDTFEVDFQLGKEIGRHDLLAGFRYRTHGFELNQVTIPSIPPIADASVLPLFNFMNRDFTEDLTSVFVQDTIALTESLNLMVGTKYEDNVTGEQWIPSARIWWNKDPKTNFWVAYSQARQLPAMAHRKSDITTAYTLLPNGSFLVDGIDRDPDRQPAELEQWDIGFRHLLSESFSLDLTLFTGKYEELTAFGSQLVFQTEFNTDTADTYGGEMAINWQPTDELRVRSSISYSDLDIKGVAAQTLEYSKANWRGNLGAIFSPNEKFSHHIHLYATEKAFDAVPG